MNETDTNTPDSPLLGLRSGVEGGGGVSPVPLPPIIRDRAYLDYLRTQPCWITGLRGDENETVDPAHIGTAGKGIKASDAEAAPFLHSVHADCHQYGEIAVLRERAPDYLLRAAFKALAREDYRAWLEQMDKSGDGK